MAKTLTVQPNVRSQRKNRIATFFETALREHALLVFAYLYTVGSLAFYSALRPYGFEPAVGAAIAGTLPAVYLAGLFGVIVLFTRRSR